MTEQKHTNGPWEISEDINGHKYITWNTGGRIVPEAEVIMNVARIGSCYEMEYAKDKLGQEEDRDAMAFANARLIAAAPDLLEALGLLIEVAVSSEWSSETDYKQRIEKARDAIKKAKGE